MVNLYDSYQQSKVMNIIPDSASQLLKAKKEKMAADIETNKLADDIANSLQVPLKSGSDAKEVGEKAYGYMSRVKSVMSDPNLDEYGRYGELAKIKREVAGDTRLFNIAQSNKLMIAQSQKISPALIGVAEQTILKELRTPDDGTLWTGNLDLDLDKEVGNTLNRAYAALPEGEFTHTYKDKEGKDVSIQAIGVSDESINNYIEENADRLMNENPAMKLHIIDGFIRQHKRTPYRDGEASMSDVMIDDEELTRRFKDDLRSKLSEYAHHRAVTKDKGISVYTNVNLPKVDKEVPPLDPLFRESVPMYKNISSKLGLNGEFGTDRFNGAIAEKFGKGGFSFGDQNSPSKSRTFKTPTTTASSKEYSSAVWEDGGQVVSDEYRSVVNNYGDNAANPKYKTLKGSTAKTSKDVILIPNLANASMFAYGLKGDGKTEDATSGSQIFNQRLSEALYKAGQRSGIYTTSTGISSTMSIMADGSVGSVARVTVSNKKNPGGTDSNAKDIFSEVSWTKGTTLFDHIESLATGEYRIPIGNGLAITLLKTKVTEGGQTYNEYSFDVIKKAMSPREPLFMQSVYQRATGKPGLSTLGAGYSNSDNFR